MLHMRKITEKYEIFKKKLTMEKRVLLSHGNMNFYNGR